MKAAKRTNKTGIRGTRLMSLKQTARKKNITHRIRGTDEFKKGYEPRVNLASW
jgi:hypothetical protein